MGRECGFYWVNIGGEWVVAEWIHGVFYGYWQLTGIEKDAFDSHLDEIDERRIERKD